VKLIAGLGNPGTRYQGSRHNLGAEAVVRAARMLGVELSHSSLASQWGRRRSGSDAVLALPLTYMNLSGQAVAALSHYFKISPPEILVVSDDLNLPLGQLRFRRGGSAGGHNGLKSVIECLGGDDFSRLRLGLGRPEPGMDQVDFVLSRFRPEEKETVQILLEKAAAAVQCWLERGLEAAAREFNG
jgi:peptidyl-tRNA hydrolase, PTH1 family